MPPPHHGQSYAVQLLLNGLGGNRRNNPSAPNPTPFQIDCYHVNARLSQTHADIGKIRPQKFLVVLGRSLEAIWCRFRFGVRVFYYVPAPRKRAAVYRDFIVLTLCRPFFKHLVLHWHAAGLGEWLDEPAQRRLRG
ncbi:MAG TPA: hypothetical protein VFD66_03720, partial [Verrucomicrobiae bacterium]|nr:hypothetical protein [Verrucomicrobiae bacterium]